MGERGAIGVGVGVSVGGGGGVGERNGVDFGDAQLVDCPVAHSDRDSSGGNTMLVKSTAERAPGRPSTDKSESDDGKSADT